MHVTSSQWVHCDELWVHRNEFLSLTSNISTVQLISRFVNASSTWQEDIVHVCHQVHTVVTKKFIFRHEPCPTRQETMSRDHTMELVKTESLIFQTNCKVKLFKLIELAFGDAMRIKMRDRCNCIWRTCVLPKGGQSASATAWMRIRNLQILIH